MDKIYRKRLTTGGPPLRGMARMQMCCADSPFGPIRLTFK